MTGFLPWQNKMSYFWNCDWGFFDVLLLDFDWDIFDVPLLEFLLDFFDVPLLDF